MIGSECCVQSSRTKWGGGWLNLPTCTCTMDISYCYTNHQTSLNVINSLDAALGMSGVVMPLLAVIALRIEFSWQWNILVPTFLKVVSQYSFK